MEEEKEIGTIKNIIVMPTTSIQIQQNVGIHQQN